MLSKRLVLVVLLLGFGHPGIGWAQGSPVDPLVREALANNPELAAMQAQWEQARHKILQVRSLEDPMLSFAFSNYPIDSFASDDTPMTGNELRLAQKFPFPGKLAAQENLAAEKAAWYRAVYLDARHQVARQVKDAWYRLYFQDRAIAVVERNLALVDEVIRLTETRYEVGRGLQQDVLKAHVERTRLHDQLIQLQQQRISTLADLNTQLGRPTTTPVETPAEIEWVQVELSLEGLRDSAATHRPMFDAYRALAERFQAERRVAELNYKPDLTLWAGYRFRDDNLPDGGTDFVSAGVSLNLPIYRARRDAAVAEAGAGLRAAQRQFDNFRNKVHFNVDDAFSRMAEKQEQTVLYHEGLIPQATQAFHAAMSAYQVGQVEFLTLLDALMKLYSYELDYFRYQSDYLRSVARLEAETGLVVIGSALPPADLDD